tara:strand:- start:599 stop:865 length:267 start_codon:yes stop_codon:yes gene_type:complete
MSLPSSYQNGISESKKFISSDVGNRWKGALYMRKNLAVSVFKPVIGSKLSCISIMEVMSLNEFDTAPSEDVNTVFSVISLKLISYLIL